MAPRKRKILAKETLLAVGEGHSEKAFLHHIKSLYCNGKKITIITANGKGPANVIEQALGTYRCTPFNKVMVLMDCDLVWPTKKVKEATAKGFILIGSTPCLEGLLLDILNQKKCTTNNGCKELLHPQLNGSSTERDSYVEKFNKAVLDEMRTVIKGLDEIISAIED
ncbi:RloB domain-containing protein [Pantoea sp. App145]|uniref:RloB domain-containing protein n=1 Tax=Pantoea sp. App145 TaxID=3071567 RepID=UPI003A7FDA35